MLEIDAFESAEQHLTDSILIFRRELANHMVALETKSYITDADLARYAKLKLAYSKTEKLMFDALDIVTIFE